MKNLNNVAGAINDIGRSQLQIFWRKSSASEQPVSESDYLELSRLVIEHKFRGSRSFRRHGTGVEINFLRIGGTVLAVQCCKCAIKFVTKHFLYEHSKLFR